MTPSSVKGGYTETFLNNTSEGVYATFIDAQGHNLRSFRVAIAISFINNPKKCTDQSSVPD